MEEAGGGPPAALGMGLLQDHGSAEDGLAAGRPKAPGALVITAEERGSDEGHDSVHNTGTEQHEGGCAGLRKK